MPQARSPTQIPSREKYYEDENRVIYTGKEHVIVLDKKNYTVQIWHMVIDCTVIEANFVCYTKYFMIEEKLSDIITWKRAEEERLNEAIKIIEENGTDRMARAWRPAHCFMKCLEKEDIDKLYKKDSTLYDAIIYTKGKLWDEL